MKISRNSWVYSSSKMHSLTNINVSHENKACVVILEPMLTHCCCSEAAVYMRVHSCSVHSMALHQYKTMHFSCYCNTQSSFTGLKKSCVASIHLPACLPQTSLHGQCDLLLFRILYSWDHMLYTCDEISFFHKTI